MVPERASVDYFNTKYVENVKFNVRRNGRKSVYIVNIEATIKHAWGDNISLHVSMYELLQYEYKPTFVEFHFEHICKMLNSDPLIGKALLDAAAKAGITTCPVPPKHYILANMSVAFANFPYVWPFEKAKGIGIILHGKTVIGKGSLYMRFLQK
ncbi:hypothetical protein ABMA27_004021 [Loxostege sticticalis]|uniref:Uncharacterized protein n=1 Tax=Loxostege sticticalis TaxID=481309 RepID=A0ABR3HR80_LOXSC